MEDDRSHDVESTAMTICEHEPSPPGRVHLTEGHPTGGAPTVTRRPAGMRGITLLVLLVATFMGQFDFFVVNVAAPSLHTDLHADDVALELIVGGYAFSYAAGLITGGRLGDMFGHRRMYVVGMVSFTAASLLCGLASTPGQLIAFRLLQGLTAAAMLPQVLGLITATVPPRARPRAMAWYAVASGLGGIAGQVLGGLLVSADVAGLGWRAIFLVNVPVGVAGAALARRRLPEPASGARGTRLDPLGVLGFTATFALVLVPLTLGRSVQWAPWTRVSLAGAVVVGLATLGWQRVLSGRGGAPLLDIRLLALPSFRAGLVANLAFVGFFSSFMFTLTLFLQVGLGLSAFRAGLAFTPLAVLFSATALNGPRLQARFGRAVPVFGACLSAAAMAGLAGLVGSGGDVPVWQVTAVASVTGIGNGLTLPLLIGASLVDVAPERAGTASGALTTAQQFGGAAGVALVGSVFFAVAGAHPGPDNLAAAMARSSWVEAAMVLGVAALVSGASRRRRNDRPAAASIAVRDRNES